jgi:Protein of unknown function (DUF2934)
MRREFMAPDQDLIRKRAYEIWEREGRPHGRDLEHWQLAMVEFYSINSAAPAATNGEIAQAPKKAAPKKTPAKAKTKTVEAPSIVMPEPAKRSRTRTPAK